MRAYKWVPCTALEYDDAQVLICHDDSYTLVSRAGSHLVTVNFDLTSKHFFQMMTTADSANM